MHVSKSVENVDSLKKSWTGTEEHDEWPETREYNYTLLPEMIPRATKFNRIVIHMIRFSDLVDLWVIMIKSLWSFAHVVRRDQVNRSRNTDHAARTCKIFVYSIVKLTRLYDYQTWQTQSCLTYSRGAQRYVRFSFLNCAFRIRQDKTIYLYSGLQKILHDSEKTNKQTNKQTSKKQTKICI